MTFLRLTVAAVAIGVIAGQATLDYVFPEGAANEGFDAATWRPCPGRKPVKMGRVRAVWYCGPSPNGAANDAEAGSGSMDQIAASRSAKVGSTGSGRSNPKSLRK